MVELHLTTHGLTNAQIPAFEVFCAANGYKPIIIELAAGDIRQQPMISKVIHATDRRSVLAALQKVQDNFAANGYPVVRLKVEVPVELAHLGDHLFPDYHGRYGEWHGKVRVENEDALATLRSDPRFHVSRNQLKGDTATRFVTYRHYRSLDYFEAVVNTLRKYLRHRGFELVKEEFEYCIYDSDKSVDRGWIDTPEITDEAYAQQLAFDEFLRRQARSDNGLILKGSLVLRQFMADPTVRVPHDLDFVADFPAGTEPFTTFSQWLTEVIDQPGQTAVNFQPFSENDFWRRREYAMHDDFPTTNTDLTALFPDGMRRTVGLDISWGLKLYDEIQNVDYRCLNGDVISLRCVGLRLQLAWKLHQCLVRPRSKDIIDLLLLLRNNPPSDKDITLIHRYLADECARDGISPERLAWYVDGTMKRKIQQKDNVSILDAWNGAYEVPFTKELQTTHLKLVFKNIEIPGVAPMVEEFGAVLRRTGLLP